MLSDSTTPLVPHLRDFLGGEIVSTKLNLDPCFCGRNTMSSFEGSLVPGESYCSAEAAILAFVAVEDIIYILLLTTI